MGIILQPPPSNPKKRHIICGPQKWCFKGSFHVIESMFSQILAKTYHKVVLGHVSKNDIGWKWLFVHTIEIFCLYFSFFWRFRLFYIKKWNYLYIRMYKYVKHRKRESEVVHGKLEGCNRNSRPKAAVAKVYTHGKTTTIWH